SHDDEMLFDGGLNPRSYDSYAAYRYVWHARPPYPPALSAGISHGRTKVWMSWNGATDVAGWQVLAGSSPHSLRLVRTVSRTGFETAATLSRRFRYVAARAFASNDDLLGRTRTARAG